MTNKITLFITIMSVQFVALSQSSVESLDKIGAKMETFELEAWLGSGYEEAYGNSTYKTGYKSTSKSCGVTALEFKERKIVETDEFAKVLVKVDGNCVQSKKAGCETIFQGITCDMTMTEVEAALNANSSVSYVDSGSNMYNQTIDCEYSRADGKSVHCQFRFHANSKNGKVNKKKPTKLIAYTFKY